MRGLVCGLDLWKRGRPKVGRGLGLRQRTWRATAIQSEYAASSLGFQMSFFVRGFSLICKAVLTHCDLTCILLTIS